MPGDRHLEHGALRRSLDRLAGIGIVPAAAQPLKHGVPNMSGALRAAVLAEVPAFSNSGNPDVLPELALHVGEHVDEILRLFAGGETGTFDFVRTHAHRRAEQRFPLEA